ncbi:DNA polymerase III subunit delta' [Candidatus Omnitrophota bacterium]
MAFNDIIGQDIVVTALKNIIAGDQTMGSYLFLGPDGVGKRTTAIEFTKAINCEYKGEKASCVCASCNKINSMNHPDAFLIFPEGTSCSIKIGKVREIIYQASLKPYEGKKRVFIINDAETMNETAQNAILKLLEEPPERHILILTSSNAARLLPTVVSRCKILKFYSLSQGEIQCFLEARKLDEKEAILFSHMAMGSIGKAMDFKEKNIIAQRDRVVNDFFFRKSVLLREGVLNEQVSGDIEESLYMLLGWYRDLLVSKFTNKRRNLLNIDRVEEISSYAGRFSKEKLEKDLLNIMKTIECIRSNINPKIALFNMAVELKRG